MANKDYYQILGVTKTAPEDDIKKAYRKLAMQFHPDKNPGKEKWANEKFKEINEAYATLGDSEKRKQYDQFGTAADVNDVLRNQQTRTTFEDVMKEYGGSGLDFDFLDGVFGDLTKGGRNFTFRTVRHHYGGRPGTGVFEEDVDLEDLFRQQQQQPPPRGPVEARYEIILTKTEVDKGTQRILTRNNKKLQVKIPAGTKNGAKIRLRNALQITDKRLGDIIITVNVK